MSVLFSCCLITKNEQATLPKLLSSLEEFKKRGGEVCIADTNSQDDTVKIARDWGCKVEECGDRFVTTIDKKLANKINEHFLVDNEPSIVKAGDKLFDFASARNFSASMASNDFIITLDADEAYTVFDIDRIEQYIREGFEQFEYSFVYAHDAYGKPAVEFTQSKAFDRRKVQWVGICHEVLQNMDSKSPAKIKNLDKSIVLLEHWQIQGAESRSKYIVGLAHDCYFNPQSDRNSHYLGREFSWTGRPKSAIKELKRHVEMKKWPAERAQSMIFIGNAYGMLNQPEEQIAWYNKAFYVDSSRREALIKMAEFYRHNDNFKATAAFASAALEIPFTPYYANDMRHYGAEPEELLYWAKGWSGDIPGAQKHVLKALEYQPYNSKILDDTKFYFEYPANKIDGWMRFPELQFLYTMAKKMDSILEVGSWKGRSTHALLSGCKKGKVTSVDTFMGSAGEEAIHGPQIKDDAVYKEFVRNVGGFSNLIVNRKDSIEASKEYEDRSIDMVFIDGEHTEEGVRKDIRAWRNKAKILLCGHDYTPSVWPGVVRAIDEELGGIDGVADSIWWKWVHPNPMVSVVVPTLGRPEKLNRLLKLIPENAGYSNYEVLVGTDQFPPNNKGVPKMVKELVEKSKGSLVMYLGNDCIPQKDFLQLAVFRMIKAFPNSDGLVSLNDGYWKNGDGCTHWLASKQLLPYLDGEFFCTLYNHCGCDNELMERCRKIGKYVWAEEAKVFHDHPVQTGFKDKDMDDVYKLAYKKERMEHDRDLLHERSKLLGFELHENFVDPDTIPDVQKIPEICRFTDMIRNGKNFSFIKYGDGEITCMAGKEGENCDKHPYTRTLARALKMAYKYLNSLPDVYIPKWVDQTNISEIIQTRGNVTGDIFLHTSTSKEKYSFYETIKFSNRKKVLVGPKRLAGAKEFLNIDEMIEIPEINAFSYKFDIKPEDNTIYLFCAGMPTKVWISKLLKKNQNITCIDLGSALDPIFVGITRTRQLSITELRQYYRGLLEGTPLCQLAFKYKSDKTPLLNHGYTRFYHDLFKEKRNKVKKILEIGIGDIQIMKYEGYVTGASVFMWRDYFPNAEIYACDIRRTQLIEGEKRIHTYEVDQSQSSQLFYLIDQIGKEFDLILDDGSHITDHQIISARALIPFVKKGGYYIIEDVSQPDRVVSQLPEYKCEVITFNPQAPDDRLIVVRR